jgi:hypothetical protein
MRIKLFFCLESDSLDIPTRIIFPINVSEIKSVKHLKDRINRYIKEKSKIQKIMVREIYLENYLIPEEFEIENLIQNNDELKYNLIIKSSAVY